MILGCNAFKTITGVLLFLSIHIQTTLKFTSATLKKYTRNQTPETNNNNNNSDISIAPNYKKHIF